MSENSIAIEKQADPIISARYTMTQNHLPCLAADCEEVKCIPRKEL